MGYWKALGMELAGERNRSYEGDSLIAAPDWVLWPMVALMGGGYLIGKPAEGFGAAISLVLLSMAGTSYLRWRRWQREQRKK